MTGKFKNKRITVSAAVTLISAVAFGCISICIVAASSMDSKSEPALMTAAGEPIRISAPAADYDISIIDPEVTALPDDTFEETLSIVTSSLVLSAPEVTEQTQAVVETTKAATETTAPETTAPVTAAPETTAPVTTVPETTVPETTASEVTASLPVPDKAAERLVDQLGLIHTISDTTISVTDEEITLAATIIQLEVMGNGSSLYRFEDVQEKYWEMLSVAQCIRNRACSSLFPSTVKEVILQSHTNSSGRVVYQFSPAEKLAQYTPTAEAVIAAREVLIDGVTIVPDNYYYFCATRISSSFEANNEIMLSKNADGQYDKIEGHLTTFYAGRE